MTLSLRPDEARRLALTAQGLIGSPFGLTPRTARTASAPRRISAVMDVLHHVRAVQLDTISVLARSHELVPYSRLGPVGRSAVEEAYWPRADAPVADAPGLADAPVATAHGRAHAPIADAPGLADAPVADAPGRTFEYWSHAACILPEELWPWFAFRRRHYARKETRWQSVSPAALDELRQRLAEEGPLTTRDVGGAKSSSDWWDWSDAKVAMERLLDIGEVAVCRREGWRRVYDLAERAIAPRWRTQSEVDSLTWSSAEGIEGPDDEECVRHLIALGARSVGVGTVADIVDVHRLRSTLTSREHFTSVFADLVDDGTLVPVGVPGWKGPVYADAELLAGGPARGRHRTTLLSPFDSLIWHRGRTARVFGFDHLFEPYVPAARRQHGYFTMPVLHGGRLVARVDPRRRGRELEAVTVILETPAGPGLGKPVAGSVAGTAAALTEAAAWVGCESVSVGEVRPASARADLVAALSDADQPDVMRMSP